VVKEHQPCTIQESGLPVPNFNLFCTLLFYEGIVYDDIPKGEVEIVGTHTSIVLHPYPKVDRRWASIHYRENLQSLTDIEGLAGVRAFDEKIAVDLHLLGQRLIGDLTDVDMVYGLSQVSASWGRNHRFITKQFTKDPKIIRRHLESIKGLPPKLKDKTPPLTLFAIERAELLAEFHNRDFRKPKASVVDLVGN